MLDLIVTVSEGQLQGCIRTTSSGFQFNSYVGIPYAKPPVGQLRFRDPQPHEKWNGIRDAVTKREVNAQFNVYNKQYMGVEDSLFLNVFAPSSASPNSKLPVLFYIHGGGFYVGEGGFDLHRPDMFVERDLVVVTINYRLGSLGFLCLNSSDVPGNAGLKDQVLAMRWVQKNIGVFGGDPANVTIMGESAGAACVHYHMMSPMSRGLFVRAIMQSGSCVAAWAKQRYPEQNAFELAAKLGNSTTDKKEALAFLQSVPVEDLVMAARIYFTYDMEIPFCGVVENRYPNCEAFLVDNPESLMNSGNYNVVPCLHGFNSHEAMFFLSPEIVKLVEDGKFYINLKILGELLKRHCDFEGTLEELTKVHNFYFKPNVNAIGGFIDLVSDLFFVKDAVKSVKMLCKHNKSVYYYLFAYGGILNRVPPIPLFPYDGAGHADDNCYFFKTEEDTVELTPSDELNRNRLVTLWSNFVKHGNPTPQIDEIITTIWEPAKDNDFDCLKIKNELEMIKNPYSERIDFLNKTVLRK